MGNSNLLKCFVLRGSARARFLFCAVSMVLGMASSIACSLAAAAFVEVQYVHISSELIGGVSSSSDSVVKRLLSEVSSGDSQNRDFGNYLLIRASVEADSYALRRLRLVRGESVEIYCKNISHNDENGIDKESSNRSSVRFVSWGFPFGGLDSAEYSTEKVSEAGANRSFRHNGFSISIPSGGSFRPKVLPVSVNWFLLCDMAVWSVLWCIVLFVAACTSRFIKCKIWIPDGVCAKCGYCLDGLPRCPECGSTSA